MKNKHRRRIKVRWFDEVKPVVETAYRYFGMQNEFTIYDLSEYISSIDIVRLKNIVHKAVHSGEFTKSGKVSNGRQRMICKYKVTKYIFKNGRYNIQR